MADPLLPQDVIEGSRVRDRLNMFVVGSYDRRITFYAQQVRALSLVHALIEQGYFHSNPRIAVIGAGAAGLTAAAAAVLASNSNVVLFETAGDLLPLQSTTDRRNLDPHIYDWPALDTTDPVADLPILDWESGTCSFVRNEIVIQFNDIAARSGGRLHQRLRHRVDNIRQDGHAYELAFTDLDSAEEQDREGTDQFQIVILAIGFGVEPTETVEGIQNSSYWSDGGVPVAEFEGRPAPRFFISGSGDGGLIDFVAAGSTAFNHAAMIRLISNHPGMDEIRPIIAAIDLRARAVTVGQQFDFIAAYDAELEERFRAIGLIAAVARQLRPGVRLVLQTRDAQMFEVSTSALNRIAAYLTIKACEIDPIRTFRHVQAEVVTRADPPGPCLEPADFWLGCNGERIGVDAVIIRRGTLRDDVRRPFADHLVSFDETHREWLQRHGDATLVPRLSRAARDMFLAAARAADVPLPRRVLRQAVPHVPITVQVRREGNGLRWSGGAAPADLVRAWNDDQGFEIILPDGPTDLGAAAGAILRVCCHTRKVRLHASPAHWRDHAARLSVASPHAESMEMPVVVPGNPGGGAQDPAQDDPARFARRIHAALDIWVLARLSNQIERFLANGEDPGRSIGFEVAQDLKAAMRVTWAEWRVAFEDDAALLSRFLRLLICAIDDDADHEAAQILVGPTKVGAMARGTMVSLAIAAAWQTTGPKRTKPGNLSRQRVGAPEWTGHGCAADLIDGTAMALCAASYMWQTNFVILSVRGAIEVARSAERPFTQVETQQPSLSETGGSGPVIMWISREFTDAAMVGTLQLATLLETIETRHFAALDRAIVKGNEA